MDAQALVKEIIDKDKRRRDKLLEIYKDIKGLSESDADLHSVMFTEFDDVTQNMLQLRSSITYPECPILFAGETSAGKSSLINLLIGKSILPVGFLSCTSVICRIWNSDQRKIQLTHLHGKKEIHTFDTDDHEEKMKTFLAGNVAKGNRAKDNTLKCVDIFLSVPSLQNTIAIVDTPGIQEKNDTTLMKCLFDFLPNAIAFIYVINTINAGGLENDQWLQKILSKISEQKMRGNMLDYEIETTLFVCNKWDQVPKKEEQYVKDFIIDNLKSAWPNFNPELHLFEISCTEEENKKEQNLPPTKRYTDLVEGITRMMPKCLEGNMVRHVRWQKHFVEIVMKRISSIIFTSKQTMDEREVKLKEAEHRLDLMVEKLPKVKQSAMKKINQKGETIAKDIVHHVKTSKICSWTKDELPQNVLTPENISNAVKLIGGRMENEIRTWFIDNKDDINSDMDYIVKKEFRIIEEDLRITEGLFGSVDECRSEYGILEMLPRALFGKSPQLYFCLFGYSIFTLLAPHLALFNFAELQVEYKYNATTYMTIWSNNILDAYVTEKNIFERIEPFFNKLKERVTYVCKTIVPKKIEADKMFIRKVSKERLSLVRSIRNYQPLQRQCELIAGKIEITLVEYFPESTMSLKYVHNVKVLREIRNGTFSTVRLACASMQRKEQSVAVKTVKATLNDFSTYQQVFKTLMLSKLNKSNILKIYGISLIRNSGRTFLQIVMEYCENNLHDIVMKKQIPRACGSFKQLADCKDSWTFVSCIIEDVFSALDYIHKAGFVHHDLQLANILVKGDQSVKLADFGLIKKEKQVTGTETGSRLYLAPEVTKGELNNFESDIYSLGMVLYELWYYRPVFSRPLSSNPSKCVPYTAEALADIVSECRHPDCEIPLKPPTTLTAIMEMCWKIDKKERPTASEVCKRISDVQLK